jgi:AhpC/TSA family protein/cytochrome c biogenesis DsbD-like protein
MMLEQNGVHIAAVSYDAPEILAAFAQRHAIGFPLLSDRCSEIIRRFGIFNFNMAPELRAYGVPHPVEYLVARDGTVVNKYFVPNYQHRVTGSAVALRQFGTVDREAPAVTLESGALAVRIGFPSAKAFAGQEVAFFAKFSLQPGWHIYGAPLPEGYTTTSITFDSPNVGSQKLELPAPEMLNFPVLRETLPVYGDSFNGMGTLLLKHPLPDGKLVLPGRLGFQMCSETVCEPPQIFAFELALTLGPFLISDRDKQLQESRTSTPEAGTP